MSQTSKTLGEALLAQPAHPIDNVSAPLNLKLGMTSGTKVGSAIKPLGESKVDQKQVEEGREHKADNIEGAERSTEDSEEDIAYDIDSDDEAEWQREIMIEDNLVAIGDEFLRFPNGNHDEFCTLEEAKTYRRLLREIGPIRLLQQTVESEAITARKLITAFGYKAPLYSKGADDEEFYSALVFAMNKHLSQRQKLLGFNTIHDAVNLILNSKKIIVITGAGISTSLGIPDFRSKHTGLYSKLDKYGLDDPQLVFDIDFFRSNPEVFFSVAKDIIPEVERWSPTHAFIKLLHDQGKLLTNYTQNIDNIEAVAGLPAEKVVQCHGSFATATCQKCGKQVKGTDIYAEIRADLIPKCKACIAALGTPGQKRKRLDAGATAKSTKQKKQSQWKTSSSSGDTDDSDDIEEPGIVKPDITFFGESLPRRFHERITGHDKDIVDLVIVIGTSLKVAPVSDIITYLDAHVPQILISRDPVKHFNFDIDLLGDCDVVVAELCRRASVGLKHAMIPDGQIVDVKSVEGYTSRHLFVERKQEGEGGSGSDSSLDDE